MHNRIKHNSCGVGILPAQDMQFKCGTAYNKAYNYAFQGNVEQALKNLQQVINLSFDEYCEMAKTDSDFDDIRED